jgi:hypothetical protein
LRSYSSSTLRAKRRRRAEFVDDDRVVDDEIDGNERVDLLGIAAERHHRVAHRGKIDDGGNAGEVLHQHARRAIGDFVFDRALVVQPFGDGQDMLLGDRLAVFEAQQVLEQNLHRIGKLRNAGKAVGLSLGQAVIDIVLAITESVDRQLKLSRDLDTRDPVSDSEHKSCGRLCTNAHQDAGTAISAVRT